MSRPPRPSSNPTVAAAAVEKPWKPSDCRLVLEDGSVWPGQSFGAKGTCLGEVVFNTSLTGYQEIITDASYAGQFVLFTCPEIGNVGINPEDMESTKAHMGGMIVRHNSLNVSNYRSAQSLPEYCEAQNILGISDIDTREITRRLRDTGSLNGVISTDESKTDDELAAMARDWTIVGKDMIGTVTCKESYEWMDATDGEWEWAPGRGVFFFSHPFFLRTLAVSPPSLAFRGVTFGSNLDLVFRRRECSLKDELSAMCARARGGEWSTHTPGVDLLPEPIGAPRRKECMMNESVL